MRNINKYDSFIEPYAFEAQEYVNGFTSKRKNPTKTFIGGVVIGIFIGLFISAVFIDVTMLQ